MDNEFEGSFEQDFDGFMRELFKNNPELKNFNLDMLKSMDKEQSAELIQKLVSASKKFVDAEKDVQQRVADKIDFEPKDLIIDFDNYIKTCMNFPFAITVTEDVLDNEDENGVLKGQFFGKNLDIPYSNIYELISIKKLISMNFAKLIRTNINSFLPIRSELYSYISNSTKDFLKSLELEELFFIKDIREFNMIIELKNKKYDSIIEFYNDPQLEDENEKLRNMKLLLLTEFAIIVIES
ncbi:MAG TPA: hypothetical protein PKH64_07245 [Petrotogaceae bacterium]|jgi:hypothetical protein|nr:hypothetical protein [Petrotogaceae bacterium]HPA93681.1 hypothetical protein [Petrotogaceae bacterium]HPO26629.1 hypothetical protein [Petrotogaceae bacterium]HPX16899.1 hypothetical protein [Petrotogaceae bacterium]HQC40202.1 hypothetical protein [Petrotogaceae bacterium]